MGSDSRRRRPPDSGSGSSPNSSSADLEANSPPSSGSPTTPSASYPNYRPHSLVLLAHIVAFVLIAAVVFGPPDKGVGIIAISSEEEYVGLMRSCSAGTCSDWFAGSSTASSSSSSSSSASTQSRRDLDSATPVENILLPRQSSSSSSTTTTTSATSGSSLSSLISLPDLYLTTSLALLSAFYISLYLLPLLLLRRFRPAPSPPDPDPDSPGTRRGWRVGLKVFAYRISMLAVLVQWLLVLGVAGRCTALALTVRSGMGLSGTEGVGGGMIALHVTWILLFYAWLAEWSAPQGRLHHILTPGRPGWLFCGLDRCLGCGPGTAGAAADDVDAGDNGGLNDGASGKGSRTGEAPRKPEVAHTRRQRR
ncbi:hypothetical protein EHS25_002832 [Saitozyma podzolica]|uniref:Uncharacterized protein n=1 Tax=Saitozyma podzolica TaxID=1890683 RepID=A0A427YBX0_9TREE|nr:hypothetical protein EHS25_002832 [Saitozyma podzolica]